MPENNQKMRRQIYPFICILGLVTTVFFVCFFLQSGVEQEKKSAYHMLELYGVRTEALLDGLFHKTDVMESVVITNHGQIDKEIFDNLAEALMDGAGMRAIQCLPDGVVTYCYPQEGNEAVIGDNIFASDDRRPDAMLALETRQIALSGPYDLDQGGLGLVARNPIFIRNESGGERFWGFAVLILNLPDALKPLMLEEMVKSGYEYRIMCEVNGETVIVDRSDSAEDENEASDRRFQEGEAGKDYVEVGIKVPNHVWQMQIAPKRGWIDVRALGFQGLIGVCFTLLCTAVVYLLERQGRQMEQYATTDDLTGLFNRRRLKEYMDIRCRDKNVKFALFYIDLNHFKEINDVLGHAVGDAVLIEAGHRIKAGLGREGSVYRVGGDEFIAVREQDVNPENCMDTEAQIKGELEKPFIYEKHDIRICASIGYSIFPVEGMELDELMRLADGRMYREKKHCTV